MTVIRRSRALPALIGLLIGSALLGVIRLRELSFWFDEVASMEFATGDIAAMLHRFPDQMPAYYVVLNGWIALTGQSEVAARWLSVLFGLLTISVTYQLACRLASTRVALLSALALATSAVYVSYFREARPYQMIVMLGAASMLLYLRWLDRGHYRIGAAYVVVTSVLLYSHYFAGLAAAAQGLYLLTTYIGKRLDGRFWQTLTLHALTVAALTPYLGFYLNGLNLVTTAGKHPLALTLIQALDTLTQALSSANPGLIALLALAALLTSYRRLLHVALLWFALPLIAVLVVHTLVWPVLVNPRYVLFVWPPLAMLVGLGLDRLDGRLLRLAVPILLLIGLGETLANLPATFPGVLPDQPWHEMFSILHTDARPTDMLVVNMTNPVGFTGYQDPVTYYAQQMAPPGMMPLILGIPPYRLPNFGTGNVALGVWLMVTDGAPDDKGQQVQADMQRNGYAPCRQWTYSHGTSLSEWQKPNGPFYQFGDVIELSRTPINRTHAVYAPGQSMTVELGFHAMKIPTINYSVGLYLFDSDNHLVAQQDGPPANELTRYDTATWGKDAHYCDVHRLSAPQTPGVYHLHVGIYDSRSGQKLTVYPPAASNVALVEIFEVRAG